MPSYGGPMFQVFAKSTQKWSARYGHDELEVDQILLEVKQSRATKKIPTGLWLRNSARGSVPQVTQPQILYSYFNYSDEWFGEFSVWVLFGRAWQVVMRATAVEWFGDIIQGAPKKKRRKAVHPRKGMAGGVASHCYGLHYTIYAHWHFTPNIFE